MAEAFGLFEWDDQRESLEGHIANLGADEAARDFGQAAEILEGLCYSAESIGVRLHLALVRAHFLKTAPTKAAFACYCRRPVHVGEVADVRAVLSSSTERGFDALLIGGGAGFGP